MRIRSFYLNPNGQIERDLSPDRAREAREDSSGLLWIDISDPDFEAGEFLSDTMKFHPLAVEDAMSPRHQPAKVEEFDSHLFLINHGIDYSSNEKFVETARLATFIAEATVVTLHRVPLISVDTLADRIERDARIMERPASLFCYSILDLLYDAILPTLDHLSDVAAELDVFDVVGVGGRLDRWNALGELDRDRTR